MRAKFIAGLLLCAATAAAAQEPKPPGISVLQVDWRGVGDALNNIEALKQVSPPATAKKDDVIARLNEATAPRFPNIAASPVPVLLPFELEAYLRDKAAGVFKIQPDIDYLAGFRSSRFFLTGPAGYDVVFTMRPADMPESSGTNFTGETEVHISGFALLYDLPEAVGADPKPAAALQADFPGLRRVYLESHMRYLFTRYGVLYAVSIECYDGPSHPRRLSCRDADPIAVRFLKTLNIAGGTPHPAAAPDAQTIARPEKRSTIFAYHAPGQLISGTGAGTRGGRADYTVYSKIRFPLEEPPAHTYSQVFMNLADCSSASAESKVIRRRGAPFHCPSGGQVAEAGLPTSASYAYPWRDNFCEARGYFVGQCPGGRGHQGQDIVPVDCKLSSQDTDHCANNLHGVVAVHDGAVLRSPGQEGLVVVVNAQNEHIRFRYLHMNPKLVDAEGFFSGRTVREAETIGKVGNYSGREGGTSYHLHFDMQVPTKDGWVLVNPYMTLVSAYERLVGGRGEEIRDEIKPPTVAEDTAAPATRVVALAPAPAHATSRLQGRRDRGKHRVATRLKHKKYKVVRHCGRRGC